MEASTKTGFMLKQTLAGEVHGLAAVLDIKEYLNKNKKKSHKSLIITEIDRQIADESRHIKIYKELLRSGKFSLDFEASTDWKSLLTFINDNSNNLPVLVTAVYGCLEQLNYYILEDHILPDVNGQEYKAVKSVLEDEATHLGMIDLYEDEMASNITPHDHQKAVEFVGIFANFIRSSVNFPDDHKMQFSKASKRGMAKDLISLRRRVEGWRP